MSALMMITCPEEGTGFHDLYRALLAAGSATERGSISLPSPPATELKNHCVAGLLAGCSSTAFLMPLPIIYTRTAPTCFLAIIPVPFTRWGKLLIEIEEIVQSHRARTVQNPGPQCQAKVCGQFCGPANFSRPLCPSATALIRALSISHQHVQLGLLAPSWLVHSYHSFTEARRTWPNCGSNHDFPM